MFIGSVGSNVHYPKVIYHHPVKIRYIRIYINSLVCLGKCEACVHAGCVCGRSTSQVLTIEEECLRRQRTESLRFRADGKQKTVFGYEEEVGSGHLCRPLWAIRALAPSHT